MPKQFQKSFQVSLPKVKISNKQIQPSLRRRSKHSGTPSFGGGDGGGSTNDTAALSDTDQFLFGNLRSFYRNMCEEDMAKINQTKTESFLVESSRFSDSLSSSSRFFVGSNSSSSLIVDQAEDLAAVDDFIAILTYAPRPYENFRRSMEDMVVVRLEHQGKVDWAFMEELLLRYLNLNNEKSCKYIIRAFVDVVVVLRENSWRIPASHRWQRSGGGVRRRHSQMHG